MLEIVGERDGDKQERLRCERGWRGSCECAKSRVYGSGEAAEFSFGGR